MTKRKKKYNPMTHLTRVMRGYKVFYDGYPENEQLAIDRYGRRITSTEWQAMRSKPWKWDIKLRVIAQYNELIRTVPIEFTVENPVKLNDLTTYVLEQQTMAMLDMPETFTFARIEWEATIV